MTQFAVRHLDHAEVTRRAGELVDLYRAAYAEPPYNEGAEHVAAYAQRLADESSAAGFTLVAAELGEDLIGYAYGIPFAADGWWTDADHEPAEVHGRPAFAVMEFIVRHDHRGRSVGTALMTALLAGRPEPYATLCANPAALARQIYHRWGWRAVAMVHPPQMPPMDVLLLELGEHMSSSAAANAAGGYKGNLG